MPSRRHTQINKVYFARHDIFVYSVWDYILTYGTVLKGVTFVVNRKMLSLY